MKNIIVTGTSRGIGLELALLFADAGHNVLALSRTGNPRLIGHQKVTTLLVDLTLEGDVQRVADFLQTSWKHVDALINNAGALVLKPFLQTPVSDFESVYKINVFAVAALTQVVIPFMRPGSHVVSISSIGGVQGSVKFAGLSAYSSSKGALITLTELLAEEFRDSGIAFNVLALGAVQTEMLAEAFPGYKAPLSALEMANYIADFTLNANKYINGKIIEVSSSTP